MTENKSRKAKTEGDLAKQTSADSLLKIKKEK